jgi:DNA-binding MarR family transcriptional regulator
MATGTVKVTMMRKTKKMARTARAIKLAPLTPREKKCYDTFRTLKQKNGGDVSPSLAEMAAAMKLGVPYVSRVIARIRDKGWLKSQPGKYRSLQLVKAS